MWSSLCPSPLLLTLLYVLLPIFLAPHSHVCSSAHLPCSSLSCIYFCPSSLLLTLLYVLLPIFLAPHSPVCTSSYLPCSSLSCIYFLHVHSTRIVLLHLPLECPAQLQETEATLICKGSTHVHLTYIHTYVHACVRACVHACIHTYIHSYMHT